LPRRRLDGTSVGFDAEFGTRADGKGRHVGAQEDRRGRYRHRIARSDTDGVLCIREQLCRIGPSAERRLSKQGERSIVVIHSIQPWRAPIAIEKPRRNRRRVSYGGDCYVVTNPRIEGGAGGRGDMRRWWSREVNSEGLHDHALRAGCDHSAHRLTHRATVKDIQRLSHRAGDRTRPVAVVCQRQPVR